MLHQRMLRASISGDDLFIFSNRRCAKGHGDRVTDQVPVFPFAMSV